MVLRPIRRRRKTPGWIRLIRWALGFLVLTLGWFALLALVRPLPLTPPPPTRELRGAWHVHTTRSDGRGSPTDGAGAAKGAGLDFLVLTDHNPHELPTPAREEGVLLVPGEESTTPFGHLADVGGRRALTDAVLSELEHDPRVVVLAPSLTLHRPDGRMAPFAGS